MEQFERELREHFRTQEPSSGFSDRVMARVRQQAEQPAVSKPAPTPRSWWMFGNRWAAAGALAACVTVGIAVQRHQSRQLAAAEIAEAQLVEQLFFAGEKINQARDRVWGAQDRGESK